MPIVGRNSCEVIMQNHETRLISSMLFFFFCNFLSPHLLSISSYKRVQQIPKFQLSTKRNTDSCCRTEAKHSSCPTAREKGGIIARNAKNYMYREGTASISSFMMQPNAKKTQQRYEEITYGDHAHSMPMPTKHERKYTNKQRGMGINEGNNRDSTC